MHLSFVPDLPKTNVDDTCKINSPIPRILFIRITEACDASCFMCSFAGNQTPHLLTIEKAKILVKELFGSTIKHIRLTGGEPLLLEDIGKIVSVFKESGFVVSIITNGMSLDKCWPDLATASLDQIIVSIDSPEAETHDKLRKTKGLFGNAVTGIKRINSDSPWTLIRVNTVVSKHNLESLPRMFIFLHDLGVKQWSLIPLKPFPKEFPRKFENIWFNVREQLGKLSGQLIEPRLMGNSLDLFGNNIEIHRRIMSKGFPKTPSPKCELVEWVRYLDFKTHCVFPCNCIPHRGKQAEQFGESLSPDSWGKFALESSRKWLKDNGPDQCEGCVNQLMLLWEKGILTSMKIYLVFNHRRLDFYKDMSPIVK